MTLEEAVKEITKNKKWYAGRFKQSTGSNIARSIIAGTAKPSTVENFMAMFGYEPIKTETTWKRKW